MTAQQQPAAAETHSALPASQTQHRYAALDAMRGLAAIAVVAYHIARPTAPSAYIAVDFFFVLSGFVIARAYSRKLAGGLRLASFMKARYLRLYPLFLLGSLYGLIQVLIYWRTDGTGGTDLAASIVSTLFLMPSPSFLTRPATDILALYPLNGPAWSLFWELLANLVFALVLFRLKTGTLMLIAAASLILLAGSAMLHHNLDLGWEWTSVDGGFARVFFSFTVGMIIYRLRSEHGTGRTMESYLALIPVAALCVCLLLPTQSLKFALVFCVLISPAIVLAGTMLEAPRRLQRACAFLGTMSYPIYMCHRGFTEIYADLFGDLKAWPLAYVGLFTVLIAIISFASMALATAGLKLFQEAAGSAEERARARSAAS